MLALLRKDAPWILVFGVAGVLVALGTVLFADPVDLLLFDYYATAEATFWTAFGGGIGLGWFAGIFDELLGARELLQQRPLSTFRLLAGKCLAVALVLVVWQVALPLAALLGWAFGSAEGLPLSAGSWLELQASLAVAWPMAFAMLFAASLPLHWLPRFVVGGAGVYVAMLLVYGIGKQDGRYEPSTYLFVSLVLAVAFAVATMCGSGQAADRDRPVAYTMSRTGRWLVVIVVVFAAAAATIEWEASVVSQLHRAYPEPWQQGREVVLVSAPGPDWAPRIVDAEHRWADRQLTGGRSLSWTKRSPWLERGNVLDQPRWRPRRQSVGGAWLGRALHLRADGSLWRERLGSKRRRWFEQVVVPGIGRFSSRAYFRDDFTDVWLLDPGQGRVWQLRTDLQAIGGQLELREIVLPNGDRVRDCRRHSLTWDSTEPGVTKFNKQVVEVAGAEGQKWVSALVVYGEQASYLEVGGSLREFDLSIGEPEDGPDPADPTDDPIEFVRTMPATAEHVAFTHAYEPRTAGEHFLAFEAQMVSSLRPPVLQVLAHVLPAGSKPGWLFDGLVVGGRRPWLVLLQIVFAMAMAWFARRYLRQLGVPAGLWTAQVALFGLPAVVVMLACESPWRLRTVVVPARPPLRIGALPVRSA